jgi:beta-hydroxylase
MELINKIPCTLAFFSVLEPGAKLSPHVGIYKGVIRYHLGLKVPKEFHKCFINVDGKNLYWEEGKDIMFDDMFTHYVENDTNEERIVLFLDIKRDFNNIFLNSLNTILLYYIKSNDLLNDTVTNINKYSI